jgi:hypothetical protein
VQLHVPSSLRVTVYSTPGLDSLGTRQLFNLTDYEPGSKRLYAFVPNMPPKKILY